jgi:acyl-CoA dehydrogenase
MIRDQQTLTLLLKTIARFVRDRLVPNEQWVEDNDRIPDGLVREMKVLGLFGLSIPEEYGGLGLTMEEEVLVALEVGRTSPAFRSLFGTNNGIGGQGIASRITCCGIVGADRVEPAHLTDAARPGPHRTLVYPSAAHDG